MAQTECTRAWLQTVATDADLRGQQRTTAVSNDHKQNKRLNHVDVRHFFIKEQVESRSITVKRIASADQPADIFTKPLGDQSFIKHRAGLGIRV